MKIKPLSLCLIVTVSLLGLSGKIFASDCTPAPDCAYLGYTKNTTDCQGMSMVKCPFDVSKVFCQEKEQEETLKAGDILYSDGSHSSEVVSGKIPIGVVFMATSRVAIALDEVRLKWAATYTPVPTSLLALCANTEPSCYVTGKDNTNTILSYGKEKGYSFPAAEYCNKYKPGNVYIVEDWFAPGQWFLPSMRELNTLYSKKAAVNATLEKLKATKLEDYYYWSSTQYKLGYAFDKAMANGNANYATISAYEFNVRPAVAF